MTTGPRPGHPEAAPAVRRQGQFIRLRPGAEQDYDRLHADVWPDVLSALSAAGLRNYSIFRHGRDLFSYSEYVGTDHAADMRRLGSLPEVQEWDAAMAELQEPDPSGGPGRWTDLPEVFHLP